MKKLSVFVITCFLVLNSVVGISPEEAAELGRPTVAVVLSGGETRGFGHVVLLETLEEMGIPIDAVYGSSSGALVGGLYCAGYSPKELRAILSEIDILGDILDLNSTVYRAPREPLDCNYRNFLSIDFSDDGIVSMSGFSKTDKLADALNQLLSGIPDDINFDDLPTRFRCTTTLSSNSDLVIPESGSLVQTICTATSMPILFVPVSKDDRVLSDGGFSNNLPVNLAREDGYDIVITEDMNYTINPDKDDLRSISSLIGAVLRTIVDREVNQMEELSDVYLTPDYSEFGSLKFKTGDEVYEIAKEEIESKRSQLEAIAALFEKGKYVKDSDRVGDYTKLYAKDSGRYNYTPIDWSRKLEDFSVVSVGITAFSSAKHTIDSSSTTVCLNRNPGINVRFFSTKLGNSVVGLDLKAGWNNGLTFDAEVPIRTVKNLFVVPEVSISINTSSWFQLNKAGLEIQYSDREKYSFEIGAFYSQTNKFYLSSEGVFTDILDTTIVSKPCYSIEYALYANPKNFSEYSVSGLAFYRFLEKEKLSMTADICAKKASSLNIGSLSFGGRFTPEFDSLSKSGNFISAGLNTKYTFKEGIVDLFTELNIRAGLVDFSQPVYGASLAFGVDSPFGDLRLGVEGDSTKSFTVFFDLR